MPNQIKEKIIKGWARVKKGNLVKEAIGQFEVYDKKKNAGDNSWIVDHSDKVVPCEIKLLKRSGKRKIVSPLSR